MYEFKDIQAQLDELKNEITRLKKHKLTLIMLIDHLIEGEKLVTPNLMGASVIYDLMGDEIRAIYQMVESY